MTTEIIIIQLIRARRSKMATSNSYFINIKDNISLAKENRRTTMYY